MDLPRPIGTRPRATTLTRAHTTTSQSRFGSHFGFAAGGSRSESSHSNHDSIEEDDEAADDGGEWGLSKGMELFEVSAKDDTGAFVD